VKVRLYVEGGPKGTNADGLRRFRNGFKQHFLKLDPRLSSLGVSPCGSTEETIRDYARAVSEREPDCMVAMLVDSDAPVATGTPAMHLQTKLDFAKIPAEARESVFLMVQCMEAWLVVDVNALEKCFGKKLKANALPPNPNIESVTKRDLLSAFANAIRDTPGAPYHKINHGAKILAELNPVIVGNRSGNARSLHAFLKRSIQM
jgi:hypothetical protein